MKHISFRIDHITKVNAEKIYNYLYNNDRVSGDFSYSYSKRGDVRITGWILVSNWHSLVKYIVDNNIVCDYVNLTDFGGFID